MDWQGGAFPYRVGHRKLGMWLFIVSDSLTFSALLIGYSYLRASNVWPTPFPFYPSIVFSSVMTFCLLSSSLTMVFGVSASSKGDKSKARKMDPRDNLLRSGFYRAPLDRMAAPDTRRPAAVLPA
jgi:cytochrome c oxidase subunit 3